MTTAPPHERLELETALSALDESVKRELSAAGFDRPRFLALAASLRDGDAATRRRERNAVKGAVEAPRPGEIAPLPSARTGELANTERQRLAAIGEAALRAGELAFCTMAGGMATRMGGIVKALCEVWDGHTFLSLRLAENRSASARYGRPIPLWLMSSQATHDTLEKALADAGADRENVGVFMQDLSLRLNLDGSLFLDDEGKPSVYATGHGDLVDALRRSGLLAKFVAGGGKYVWITNVDNLGASIDPVLLGMFIEAKTAGALAQCEVCRKEGDRGGIPARADGKLQVIEEYRLPPGFDPATVNVFNTNTFIADAESLLRAPIDWTFFEVEKKVDGRPAVQFERLIQEITAYLPTRFVEVPRDGEESRFLPVKDFDELAKRRANIEVVARARGMV